MDRGTVDFDAGLLIKQTSSSLKNLKTPWLMIQWNFHRSVVPKKTQWAEHDETQPRFPQIGSNRSNK